MKKPRLKIKFKNGLWLLQERKYWLCFWYWKTLSNGTSLQEIREQAKVYANIQKQMV